MAVVVVVVVIIIIIIIIGECTTEGGEGGTGQIGDWRKLHIEELHDLCSLQNFVGSN